MISLNTETTLNPSTEDKLKKIGLQDGYVYGPVLSRRLGVSLGINPLPIENKLCSMNCVYCQYSWTDIIRRSLDTEEDKALVPSIPTILDELRQVLARMAAEGVKPDRITLAGNGEPTLYPEFEKLVDGLIEVRDKLCPDAGLDILSNSLHLHRDDVRRGLAKLDYRYLKLDAGNEETFRRIDVPKGVTLEEVVENLKQIDDIVIQTIFIGGPSNNLAPEDISDLKDRLREMHPKLVQVYSLDRVPASSKATKVPRAQLEEIAAEITRDTGLPTEVF